MAVDIGAMLMDPKVLAAGLTLGGGILQGVGEGKRAKEDRELQRQMLIAQFLQGEGTQEREGAAAQLSALGGPFGMNDSLQRERIRRGLLEGISNVSVSAPPDIEAVRGRVSGGIRIPQGGFDTSALSEGALGEGARNYLTTLAQLNPNGSTFDASMLGLPGTGSVESARQGYAAQAAARRAQILGYLGGVGANGMPTKDGPELDRYNAEMILKNPAYGEFMTARGGDPHSGGAGLSDAERKALRDRLIAAGVPFANGMEIDPAGNLNQDHGFGPTMKKIGGVAATVAPLALNFVPGIGTAAQLAINAGLGAATGGVKGALMGAAGSAAPYLVGKLPGNPFRIPRPQIVTPSVNPSSQSSLINNYLRGQSMEAFK